MYLGPDQLHIKGTRETVHTGTTGRISGLNFAFVDEGLEVDENEFDQGRRSSYLCLRLGERVSQGQGRHNEGQCYLVQISATILNSVIV